MEKKKNVSIESQKKYFFQIGMVLALSSVLVAFEWTQFEERVSVCEYPIEVSIEETEIIPITIRSIPPKPPVQEPIFEVVDDIEEVEFLEDFETEIDEDSEPVILEMEEEEELIEEEAPYVRFPGVNAKFVGGEPAFRRFLKNNLKYPRRPLSHGIDGTVYYEFMVMEDGSISEIVLKNKIDPDLEAEALRVLKLLPNWIPASQGGRKVRTTMRLPFSFNIR